MIKIRYRDLSELSPGLHAAAERHGRSTIVYLVSGLTAPQRQSALRRLRLSARMGYCPRLPAAQLALALLAARIRAAVAQAGAIFRLHPAGIMVPVMMASGGVIAFLVLSSVSAQVRSGPWAPGPPALGAPAPAVSASAGPVAGPSPGRVPGAAGPGADRGQVTADRSRPPGLPGSTAPPSGQPGPGAGSPSPGPTASATAEPSGTASPARSPEPGPQDQPSQSPATAAFWLSAPPAGDIGDSPCLNPSQLGICLGS
jgi:hypothetical protein